MMSSRQLVSLEVLGSDEELRASSAALSPGQQPDEEPEGRDATGAATVRMDHRGRVSEVLISDRWRDELTPSGLPDAVLGAYRAALVRAAATIDPRAFDGRPSTVPQPPPDEPAQPDDLAWFDSVRRRLDRTEETLARADRLLRDEGATERVVAGPAGLVRLVLTGGAVSRVEIDTRAALQESPGRLAADALAAFHAVG